MPYLVRTIFLLSVVLVQNNVKSQVTTHLIPTVYVDVNVFQKTAFLGWTAGLGLNVKLSESWGIYSGLFYSQREFMFTYEVNPEPPSANLLSMTPINERRYNINYLVQQLNIPLSVRWSFYTTEKTALYTGLGGTLLFNIIEKDWGEKYLYDSNGNIDPGPYEYSNNYKYNNKIYFPNYIGMIVKLGYAMKVNEKIRLNPEINYILPVNIGRTVPGYDATFSLGIAIMYKT